MNKQVVQVPVSLWIAHKLLSFSAFSERINCTDICKRNFDRRRKGEDAWQGQQLQTAEVKLCC